MAKQSLPKAAGINFKPVKTSTGKPVAVGDDGSIWTQLACGKWKPRKLTVNRGSVTVKLDGVHKRVALVVLEAFHGQQPDGTRLHFIDGNRANLAAENLCWQEVTRPGQNQPAPADSKPRKRGPNLDENGLPRVPSYCVHSALNKGYVRIKGRQVYLDGEANSRESLAHYQRIIGQFMATNCTVAPTAARSGRLTLGQLQVMFVEQNEEWCKAADEVCNIQIAMRKLCGEFGEDMAAGDFTIRHFMQLRNRMVKQRPQVTRQYINQTMGRIKHAFKWANELKLFPESRDVWFDLYAVEPLKEHRTKAKEGQKKREAVSDDDFDKTVDACDDQLADMLRLMRLTGMRPEEVRVMTAGEIERRSKRLWIYRPSHHKTRKHNKVRIVPLMPDVIAILKPYVLKSDSDNKPLFMRQLERANCHGQTEVAFNRDHLSRDVKAACKAAGVKPWTPYQIRHTALTEARDDADLDTAQALGGHTNVNTTDHYTKREEKHALQAAEIMWRLRNSG